MHISEIIELYKSRTKLAGIILDPNRNNIIFSSELIEVLENIMEIKEENLKNKKNEKQYTYVSVIYKDDIVAKAIGEPSFYYKTDVKEISIGDRVLVNRNNKEVIGIVIDVQIYHESDVPYPLDKTKDIIKILNNYGDKIEVYQSNGNKYVEMIFLGKYKYIGGEYSIDLTIGNIYNRVGSENEFRIIDNSGEDYLYFSENFIKI